MLKKVAEFGKKVVSTVKKATKKVANTVKKAISKNKTFVKKNITEPIKNKLSPPKEERSKGVSVEEAGVGDYLKRSASQVVMGNFTEEVTLAGTGIQVILGLLGLDAPMDIRDIAADFVNWEWSWGHAGQTALDIVALIPLVGAVKYTDEAATLIKSANKGTDLLKYSDEVIDVVEEAVDVVSKPKQLHHFATNKNKTYTPQFEEIGKRYDLDLNDSWNKELLPHQGRHPNEYHEFVLDSMKQFDEIAQGDKDIFLKLYDNLKNNISSNPDILYKDYWKK